MEKTPMLTQIDSVPSLMEELLPLLRQKVQTLAADPRLRNARKLVLVGCGDSYCAAMAVRPLFCQITSMEIQVATAIEVARCDSRRALMRGGEKTVFVFISNSGTVSRIVEAARRIRQFGGVTVAVTGSQRSPLYGVTDMGLTMEIPKLCGGPGMRSYTASMMALAALAVQLAQEEDDCREAQQLWQQLCDLPPVLQDMLPRWDTAAKQLALLLRESRAFEFIGCGSNYANGWFAYAKELEVAGRPASAHNTEDWLHMNYFIKDVEGTATFQFIRSKAGDYSRSCELRQVAAQMGRPLVVLTDEPVESQWQMTLPAVENLLLDCFVGYLPVSMVLGHIAALLGEEDFRATRDHWTACIDFATVAASQQIVLE